MSQLFQQQTHQDLGSQNSCQTFSSLRMSQQQYPNSPYFIQTQQYIQSNESQPPNMMINMIQNNITQFSQYQNYHQYPQNQFNQFAPHPNSFNSENEQEMKSNESYNNYHKKSSIQTHPYQNYGNNNDFGNKSTKYSDEIQSNKYQQSKNQFNNNAKSQENQQQQGQYEQQQNYNPIYQNNQNNFQQQNNQYTQLQNHLITQQQNQMKGQQNSLPSQQQRQLIQSKQGLRKQEYQQIQQISIYQHQDIFPNSLNTQQQSKQKYRTNKCRHFLSGKCTLGNRCNFAHSDKEIRDPQDPLPQNVVVGQKVQITNYKTIKCRYYDNGHCKNSENCQFAHGNKELLTPGVTLDNVTQYPQQNQQILNDIQNEQMEKEYIEQQNNSDYYKSSIHDVIEELKQSFQNNPIAQKQLEDAQIYLNNEKIIKAHQLILDLFNNPSRKVQEKEYILSIIKKFNLHYKGILEAKYKSEQTGYNQSNFFQQISFDGFSQELQNAHMNSNDNNNNIINIQNNTENKVYSTNSKSASSTTSASNYMNSNTLSAESDNNFKGFPFEDIDKYDFQDIQNLNQKFRSINLDNSSIDPNNEEQSEIQDYETLQRKKQIYDVFQSENTKYTNTKNNQDISVVFHNVFDELHSNNKNSEDQEICFEDNIINKFSKQN